MLHSFMFTKYIIASICPRYISNNVYFNTFRRLSPNRNMDAFMFYSLCKDICVNEMCNGLDSFCCQ